MSLLSKIDEAIAIVDRMMGSAPSSAAAPAAPAAPAPQPSKPAPAAPKPAAPKKEKADAAPAKPATAPKPSKAAAAPAAAAGGDADVALFSKALLKVAKVVSVEELPNSEKLYKCQVDIGGETKQVCAGLRLYVPKDTLSGSLVCVVLNLKPAKLAGQLSEAMMLAADYEKDGATVVRLLQPPAGSAPGDHLHLEGAPTDPTTAAKVLKSDDWKAVVADLAVADGRACFRGRALASAKGVVTLPADVPSGSGIH